MDDSFEFFCFYYKNWKKLQPEEKLLASEEWYDFVNLCLLRLTYIQNTNSDRVAVKCADGPEEWSVEIQSENTGECYETFHMHSSLSKKMHNFGWHNLKGERDPCQHVCTTELFPAFQQCSDLLTQCFSFHMRIDESDD